MESSARAQRVDGQPQDNRVIRVFTHFSPSQKSLVQKLIASFPWEPNFELHIKYFSQDAGAKCPWGSESRSRKFQYVVESFDHVSEGQFVFHLDSEVVFLRPIYDDLLRLIDGSSEDILFLNADGSIGLGCFLARKSVETVRLFANAAEKLSDSKDGVCPLNALLPDSGVMTGWLPERYQTSQTAENVNVVEPWMSEVFLLHGNGPSPVEAELGLGASMERHRSAPSAVPA